MARASPETLNRESPETLAHREAAKALLGADQYEKLVQSLRDEDAYSDKKMLLLRKQMTVLRASGQIDSPREPEPESDNVVNEEDIDYTEVRMIAPPKAVQTYSKTTQARSISRMPAGSAPPMPRDGAQADSRKRSAPPTAQSTPAIPAMPAGNKRVKQTEENGSSQTTQHSDTPQNFTNSTSLAALFTPINGRQNQMAEERHTRRVDQSASSEAPSTTPRRGLPPSAFAESSASGARREAAAAATQTGGTESSLCDSNRVYRPRTELPL